jgi:outer membrane lipoprotein-sorting protein
MRRLGLVTLALLLVLSGCNALGPQQSSSSTATQSAAEVKSQTVAAINATETYHITVNRTIRVSRTTKRAVNFTGEKQMTNYTRYQVINTTVDGVIDRQERKAHLNMNQSTLGRSTAYDQYLVNRTLYRHSPSYTRYYSSQWVKKNIPRFPQMWRKFDVLERQRKILNVSAVTLNGTETVNGVKTYRLEVNPDGNRVKNLVFGPGRKGNLSLKNITATYWINRETMRPVRMTYQLAGTRTVRGREYDVETQIELRFSHYNESMSIELPAAADTAVSPGGNTTERNAKNRNTTANGMDTQLMRRSEDI